MRIIHTRKRVFEKDHAFRNKMVLLVWILSAIKWKEYGNDVILYADEVTLKDIKKIGFDILYDEINLDLFENPETYKNIDSVLFWAMPKLFALQHEKLVLGNDCVISDQDVVPMSDISRLWTNSDVAVWSNTEFINIRMVYPKLYELSVPQGYTFPSWFTGTAKPLNTGILHIKDPDIVKLYTDEALKYCRNNKNTKNNSACITMCNCEQRMLGEIVKHKKLSYSVMQPINKGLFNANGFHTHGYKAMINYKNGLDWHLNLLLMIKKSNQQMFDILIDKPMFKEEKKYFEINGYRCKPLKEFAIYNEK